MNLTYSNNIEAVLSITDSFHRDINLMSNKTLFKFIWIKSGTITIEVDYVESTMHQNQIITLSPYQQIKIKKVDGEYVSLNFNSNFYCIYGHDEEVSCNGILFHGSSAIIVIELKTNESKTLEEIVTLMRNEFGEESDNLHEEMLRILLKRFIITCTRIARNRYKNDNITQKTVEIIRQYYALVDEHFRDKKRLKDYATLLNCTSRSISYIFSTASLPPPLQIIQDRIEAEAKRLLIHTSKPVKEIAYLLGYEDSAIFSRFFKHKTGVSVSNFRKNKKSHTQNIDLSK